MLAIETSGLGKSFKKKNAVKSLDLKIHQGELYSLLGVNGAGKTTTIKMLSCILQPTRGDALLLGNSILHAPQKVKEKINLSPQETAVARNLTVFENLQMIAGIYGLRNTRKRAAEMIDAFSLGEAAKNKAKTLSGGMQRRLSISMALISQPRILFLDEPTLGLDVLAKRNLWELIQNLKGQRTIILTTHNMEEAQTLSDRIGIMYEGMLKAEGTAEQLMCKTKTTGLENAFISLVTTREAPV